jgi:hypothetical protein
MDNLRGILLMVASMAGFALEDMFIKWTSAKMPTGQILVMLSVSGTPIFAALVLRQGVPLWSRDLFHPAVIARNVGEMVGTLGFITAITLTPLTSATAIFQATPLVVTLGAAVLFGEEVGWQRWLAMAVGFAGVLIVIRPGLDGFEPASLWAVLAVLGLSCATWPRAACRPPSSPCTSRSPASSPWGCSARDAPGERRRHRAHRRAAGPPDRRAHLRHRLVLGHHGGHAPRRRVRRHALPLLAPDLRAHHRGLGVSRAPRSPHAVGATLIIVSGLYTLNRERQRRRDSRLPT